MKICWASSRLVLPSAPHTGRALGRVYQGGHKGSSSTPLHPLAGLSALAWAAVAAGVAPTAAAAA